MPHCAVSGFQHSEDHQVVREARVEEELLLMSTNNYKACQEELPRVMMLWA
jgi:hypothetical protein